MSIFKIQKLPLNRGLKKHEELLSQIDQECANYLNILCPNFDEQIVEMLNTYKDEQIPIPEITRHIVESLGGGISPFQLFNPIENLDDIIENELDLNNKAEKYYMAVIMYQRLFTTLKYLFQNDNLVKNSKNIEEIINLGDGKDFELVYSVIKFRLDVIIKRMLSKTSLHLVDYTTDTTFSSYDHLGIFLNELNDNNKLVILYLMTSGIAHSGDSICQILTKKFIQYKRTGEINLDVIYEEIHFEIYRHTKISDNLPSLVSKVGVKRSKSIMRGYGTKRAKTH